MLPEVKVNEDIPELAKNSSIIFSIKNYWYEQIQLFDREQEIVEERSQQVWLQEGSKDKDILLWIKQLVEYINYKCQQKKSFARALTETKQLKGSHEQEHVQFLFARKQQLREVVGERSQQVCLLQGRNILLQAEEDVSTWIKELDLHWLGAVREIILSERMQQVCTEETIFLPNYFELKSADMKWTSEAFSTQKRYKYNLVVRPNGLQFADGYKEASAIWLNPLPSDHDDTLPWPAKVDLSIKIGNLSIPKQTYTWKRCETRSHYPAFNFDLTKFKHEVVEDPNSKSIVGGSLCITLIEHER